MPLVLRSGSPIPEPPVPRALSPREINLLRTLLRSVDRLLDNDGQRALLPLREALKEENGLSNELWNAYSFNRRKQCILLANAYLCGREATRRDTISSASGRTSADAPAPTTGRDRPEEAAP